ncbi:hypothetical protein D3C72_1743180 [compost metagenome]
MKASASFSVRPSEELVLIMFQPITATRRPPPRRTMSIDRPNISSMYEPISMKKMISKVTLMAMRVAMARRVSCDAPSVRVRKIADTLTGLRMGSMVATTSRKLLLKAAKAMAKLRDMKAVQKDIARKHASQSLRAPEAHTGL